MTTATPQQAAALRDMLGDIARQDFPVLDVPPGPWSYRVGAVHADGRCNLVAIKKGPPPDLPNVDHWSASGTSSRPVVGSIVVVSFLDGDPSQPMIGAYQPLRVAGGKPTEVKIDGDTVKIGPTANMVVLAGGFDPVALSSLTNGNITAIGSILTAVALILNKPGAVVGVAGAVPEFVASSVAASKVTAQ